MFFVTVYCHSRKATDTPCLMLKSLYLHDRTASNSPFRCVQLLSLHPVGGRGRGQTVSSQTSPRLKAVVKELQVSTCPWVPSSHGLCSCCINLKSWDTLHPIKTEASSCPVKCTENTNYSLLHNSASQAFALSLLLPILPFPSHQNPLIFPTHGWKNAVVPPGVKRKVICTQISWR